MNELLLPGQYRPSDVGSDAAWFVASNIELLPSLEVFRRVLLLNMIVTLKLDEIISIINPLFTVSWPSSFSIEYLFDGYSMAYRDVSILRSFTTHILFTAFTQTNQSDITLQIQTCGQKNALHSQLNRPVRRQWRHLPPSRPGDEVSAGRYLLTAVGRGIGRWSISWTAVANEW